MFVTLLAVWVTGFVFGLLYLRAIPGTWAALRFHGVAIVAAFWPFLLASAPALVLLARSVKVQSAQLVQGQNDIAAQVEKYVHLEQINLYVALCQKYGEEIKVDPMGDPDPYSQHALGLFERFRKENIQ